MKYLGSISDGKDLVNKDYVDSRTGVTGVKGSSESNYRTGNVNLTAANVGAIPTNTNGNTQNLYRPIHLNGLNDNTLDSKINTLRANRLAFLPADQIIIEKTTDGGTTWVDAGISDSTKVGLFSETRAGVTIPLLNGVKSLQCGLRITFTAMKYNVPAGTAETAKYNYWNSNYILSTERYNQLKEMYFWVSTNSDTVSVKLERATGAASTTWVTVFNESTWGMTGWSGNDYIRFSQGVFGGGTNQTTNYWNYRLTFMTRGVNGGTTMATTYTTSAQSIMEIRGYGDTWWTAGNEYAANDKLYTHDYQKNVTFPAQVTAVKFSGMFEGRISQFGTTRQTSVDLTATGVPGVTHLLVTSVTSVGKPTGLSNSDGHILHLGWDNNAGYDTQLYIQNNNTPHMRMRGQNGGTWGSWYKVYSENDKPSAADIGAATSGHTHTTSIATSTGTNQITLSGGGKYAITAGGTSYIFTMPSIPSIPSNNITGSGTSGQLALWNGTNTITNGPKITASTNAPSGGSNGDIWFVYS